MSTILNTLSDKQVSALIQTGQVGVIPTDTVYGLVTAASNKQAVAKLYALKSREHKPGTIVAANIEQFITLGFKTRYLKAVEGYWPNPVSVIIPAEPGMEYLHLGLFSLALRVPDYQPLTELLLHTGPLLTTSANHPGEKPAENVSEAENYFGDKVDFYVDGGDLSGRMPSTVMRVIDDEIEVIREGAVKINANGEIE